jgi:hypothetical protein
VCTLVVIDLIDVPANALRRLPASTWFRVERAIEGSDTAVLILAAMPSREVREADRLRWRTANHREREPGTGYRVIWKGDHDRSRRIARRANTASVNARAGHMRRASTLTPRSSTRV